MNGCEHLFKSTKIEIIKNEQNHHIFIDIECQSISRNTKIINSKSIDLKKWRVCFKTIVNSINSRIEEII